VIVPIVTADPGVRACLASLRATDPRPGELIVVVDGGDPGAVEFARSEGATVVTLPVQSGPAAARNAGAEAASGDVLLFFDGDVIAPCKAISDLNAALTADPGIAAVFGSYDDAPACPSAVSQYRNLLHHFTHQRGREEAWTFWGACGAVHRRVFLSVGGFDPSYAAPAIEDIEFGYRLRAAGYRIRLVKTVQVTHLKRWTPSRMIRADLFSRAVPWTTLILRDHRAPNDLNIDWRTRSAVLLTGLCLAGVVGSLVHPAFLAGSAIAALAVTGLEAPFLSFLLRRRGLLFAIQSLPWHFVYLFNCGLGFVLGCAWHVLRGRTRRDTRG
jgi:GT2 family glycosyltransferase